MVHGERGVESGVRIELSLSPGADTRANFFAPSPSTKSFRREGPGGSSVDCFLHSMYST